MPPYEQDDFDFEGWVTRFTQAVDAGQIQPPVQEPTQQMWFSVAGTDDPAVLEPGAFAQHGPMDTAEPDALLAAQATAMAADGLEGMSDNALLGLVGAARRLAGRAAAIQQRAVAEYARRHTEPPGSPRASRAGFTEFCADDLAPELVINTSQAETAMLEARNAQRRLPGVCGLLWAGRISEYQMRIITGTTCGLTDAGAAEADAILARSAGGLTPGQTRALARRVVLMIDPDAAKVRKQEAAKRARVEKFAEDAGTAALCGRDLPPDAVLAAWQHIDATARALQATGIPQGIERLRAAVYLALTSGSDPLTILAGLTSAAGDPNPTHPVPDDEWPWETPNQAENPASGDQDGPDGDGGTGCKPDSPKDPRQPQGPANGAPGPGCGTAGTGTTPFTAIINLLVPADTLFEQGSAPGEIPGYGPLDPETTRDLVQAASAHPHTRWCITTIGPDGTAQEHGCVPGQHRWTPASPGRDPNRRRSGGGARDGPDVPPDQQPPAGPGDEQQPAAAGFLARLPAKLAPIAAGDQDCDHQHCTDRYQVPGKLKHLIQARRATCVAPGCNRPAHNGDADHTLPWPQGPTCQENLGSPCRYHHRNKQAPGWKLEQSTPGMFEWRAPSGRTRTTHPATYLT